MHENKFKRLKKIAIYQGEARAIKTITASKLEAVCGFSRTDRNF